MRKQLLIALNKDKKKKKPFSPNDAHMPPIFQLPCPSSRATFF